MIPKNNEGAYFSDKSFDKLLSISRDMLTEQINKEKSNCDDRIVPYIKKEEKENAENERERRNIKYRNFVAIALLVLSAIMIFIFPYSKKHSTGTFFSALFFIQVAFAIGLLLWNFKKELFFYFILLATPLIYVIAKKNWDIELISAITFNALKNKEGISIDSVRSVEVTKDSTSAILDTLTN